MASTQARTDLGLGLGIVFTVLGVIAAGILTAVSYLYVLEHDPSLQVASGLALAGALLAGGLAITVLHAYA